MQTALDIQITKPSHATDGTDAGKEYIHSTLAEIRIMGMANQITW